MSKELKKLIDIERLKEFKSKLNVFESLPAGVIIPFAGTSVPTGYLLCNGAAVSRTNYANLFAAIGTLYGDGDGSTTFNLPDARDRVLQGASSTYAVGTSIAAGLPDISGSLYVGTGHGTPSKTTGSFYAISGVKPQYFLVSDQNSGGIDNIGFEAKRSNALYGASTTVQSPAVATNFIIKY